MTRERRLGNFVSHDFLYYVKWNEGLELTQIKCYRVLSLVVNFDYYRLQFCIFIKVTICE